MKKNINKETIFKIIIFILYAIFNFILLLKHEPWRDEIHAWLMAKVYSIPELFAASRFDGHPILWHLILMPFAKLNFPIITLNIISYILVTVSAYLFLFKTNFSILFKIIVLFTIPFTYTYSAISRNYSLILLLLVIIGIFYNKRYDNPIIYSILICLLIHTHSLAWGIVAGLTITFHFVEIYKNFIKKEPVKNIKKIVIGLFLIVFNTLLVVYELYGTTNSDYGHYIGDYVIYIVSMLCLILASLLLCSIWTKKYWKEFIVITISYAFQIIVYTCFYSSILYQRLILIFVLLLFYLILLNSSGLEKKRLDIICIAYLLFVCIFALKPFVENLVSDVKYNYSSAIEMADYINNELPQDSTILIDASIIGQSIIPYLNTAKFYDIAYNTYVDCANVSHDRQRIIDALTNLSDYSGNYLIICNNFVELNNNDAKLVFETGNSIINEHFTLYYVY